MPDAQSAPPATHKRLFFALWPDDALRAELDCLRLAYSEVRRAKRVPAANLHLTLAFLGDVPLARIPCVEQAGDAIRAQAFSLCLDRVGFWPRPQVFWFGASRPGAVLPELARDLGRGLSACEIPLDTRPFKAHLTVARRCRRGPLRPLPLEAAPVWRVNEFVLVESTLSAGGSLYQVMRRWPLAAGA